MTTPSTHRVGIIGLGTVGARFVEQFGAHRDFTVTAGWDASDAARQRFSGVIPIMNTATEVLEACDLVYIAVPPAAHGTYVHQALAAGVAIFCEKPLGVDLAESEQMTAAVDAARARRGVNFVFAGAPATVRLGELLADGAAGQITRIEIRLQFPQWPRPWQEAATWLAGAAEGGWLREVGSHFLFLAHRLCGELSVEHATVRRPRADLAENRVIAELRAGDVEVLLTGASGEAGPEVVECVVRGTERSFRLREWYRLTTCTRTDPIWAPMEVDAEPNPAHAAYRAQLDQVAAMARGDAHALATFAEALAVQTCVETILAAK